MAEPEEKQHRVKFDSTINLGHILTFFGFIGAGFGAWATLDSRLVQLEEGRKTQAAIDSAQDARYEQGIVSMQNQLYRIDGKLDRLIEKGSR